MEKGDLEMKKKGKIRKILDVLAGRKEDKKVLGIKEAGELLNMTAGRGEIDDKLLRDIVLSTAYVLGADVKVLEQGAEKEKNLAADVESAIDIFNRINTEKEKEIEYLQEEIASLRRFIAIALDSANSGIAIFEKDRERIRNIMKVFED